MSGKAGGWVEILSNEEAEALWAKLFRLVSRHSSIRSLLEPGRIGRDGLQDMYADITQDLFLKLHKKNRWRCYITNGYSDTDIEHELYHIEVPNMVSLLLRDRHPEAYRMARRISTLVQTRPEFRMYSRQGSNGKTARRGKMILKVYGLAEWPLDKPRTHYQNLQDSISDVAFRGRGLRRAGRGGNSQIIISNSDLTDLTVEIFRAIDSPTDIRILRSLVLSKLPIEDSRFISIDAALGSESESNPEPPRVDLADVRPTPEQILLEKESIRLVEELAIEILERMREAVRHKPARYDRLTRVAWHCYFDVSYPSQTSIAKQMGISNSLVSHYRKLFDMVIRGVKLNGDQYTTFLHAFGASLEKSIAEMAVAGERTIASPEASVFPRYLRTFAAAASVPN